MKFLGNKATVMPLGGRGNAGLRRAAGKRAGALRHALRRRRQALSRKANSLRRPKHKPKPKAPAGRAAVACRISSPSYYTYKSRPARARRLLGTRGSAAAGGNRRMPPFVPSATGTAFREAIAGLDDYELYAEPDIAKALIAYYSANPDFIWVTRNQCQQPRAGCGAGAWRGGELRPHAGRLYGRSAGRQRIDGRRRCAAEGTRPLRDGAVGARPALRPRRTKRPRRSQPHDRLL